MPAPTASASACSSSATSSSRGSACAKSRCPSCRTLHETIGEAINLGARHDDEIVYIERTSSGRALVRVVYLVGGRAPLHLTSLGKLFLAADTPQQVRDYARRTGLPGKTPHSLTTLAALEKELDKVRRHGIAYDDEEAEIGLKCVAAPIHDDEGHVVAALSVSAPADRHDPAWAAQVSQTADAVSRALGYIGTKKIGLPHGSPGDRFPRRSLRPGGRPSGSRFPSSA